MISIAQMRAQTSPCFWSWHQVFVPLPNLDFFISNKPSHSFLAPSHWIVSFASHSLSPNGIVIPRASSSSTTSRPFGATRSNSSIPRWPLWAHCSFLGGSRTVLLLKMATSTKVVVMYRSGCRGCVLSPVGREQQRGRLTPL